MPTAALMRQGKEKRAMTITRNEHRITWTSASGKQYDEAIPDIWLAGFCTYHDCSVEQAVAWWMQQSEMDELS